MRGRGGGRGERRREREREKGRKRGTQEKKETQRGWRTPSSLPAPVSVKDPENALGRGGGDVGEVRVLHGAAPALRRLVGCS